MPADGEQRRAQIVDAAQHTILRDGRDREQFRADLDPDAAVVLVVGFLKSLLTQLDLTAERARGAAGELMRAVLR
jgi:hypothetical protein